MERISIYRRFSNKDWIYYRWYFVFEIWGDLQEVKLPCSLTIAADRVENIHVWKGTCVHEWKYNSFDAMTNQGLKIINSENREAILKDLVHIILGPTIKKGNNLNNRCWVTSKRIGNKIFTNLEDGRSSKNILNIEKDVCWVWLLYPYLDIFWR